MQPEPALAGRRAYRGLWQWPMVKGLVPAAIGIMGLLAPSSEIHAGQCAYPDLIDRYASLGNAPEPAACSTYLTQTAQTGVSCRWTHPFRSTSARALADVIWAQIAQCRRGARLGPDLPVNHPDSYLLRTWRTDQAVYSVAVKDKAARNQTLVFLRVEPTLSRPTP